MVRPRKTRSPLDERGRQLAEEEHRLQAQVAALERELKDAPRRQAEEARQRREAFLERSRRDVVSPGGRSPRRAGSAPGGRRYTPMLKRERRAARLKALALFVIFLAVVAWLASSYLF